MHLHYMATHSNGPISHRCNQSHCVVVIILHKKCNHTFLLCLRTFFSKEKSKIPVMKDASVPETQCQTLSLTSFTTRQDILMSTLPFPHTIIEFIEFMATDPEDIPGTEERVYPVHGGYDSDVGDTFYKRDLERADLDWWAWACSSRPTARVPKRLEHLVACLENQEQVWHWFNNAHLRLNVIECLCYCCSGAMPVVRFFHAPPLQIQRWGKLIKDFPQYEHLPGEQLTDWIRQGKPVASRHVCKFDPASGSHVFFVQRMKPIQQSRVYCLSRRFWWKEDV